jgi:dTDP-4-amino-4,6-dideoxygalactose transaminase
MLTTDDDRIAERTRIMRLHGISKDAWKRYTTEGNWYYEIIAPGFKYNLTDIAAAMGLAQLKRAYEMLERRRHIAGLYNEAFKGIATVKMPFYADEHAWHLYVIRLDTERLRIDRSQFIEELKARGIGTSVHFIPLHIHPYYRDAYHYQPTDYPISFYEYQKMISLPIYSKMSSEDVWRVVEEIGEVIKLNRR